MLAMYRAVVVCIQDPCTYCRNPAARHPQTPTFPTGAEAGEHGRAMARNVYGSSVHRVEVEMREMTPWQTVVHFG
jgi:hypothetical protein